MCRLTFLYCSFCVIQKKPDKHEKVLYCSAYEKWIQIRPGSGSGFWSFRVKKLNFFTVRISYYKQTNKRKALNIYRHSDRQTYRVVLWAAFCSQKCQR